MWRIVRDRKVKGISSRDNFFPPQIPIHLILDLLLTSNYIYKSSKFRKVVAI
jgi:hypothetical protein